MPIRCRTFAGGRCCEARHSPRRQGEMCRCAHECDVLELRLHGVSAHFCGAWRNRRFLRQCICRYVQSIPLDAGTCASAGTVVMLCASCPSASAGTVVMLCASCPSAASSMLMTASLGMDSVYGSRIIFMTSILSVFAIPMLALVASLILL